MAVAVRGFGRWAVAAGGGIGCGDHDRRGAGSAG